MFKDAVEEDFEMPYSDCNYRAEASVVPGRRLPFSEGNMDNIFEFWPLKCPEPLSDDVKTWGDQYPDLYQLAIEAVRQQKCEAAIEILISLPDMNATLRSGGWLF